MLPFGRMLSYGNIAPAGPAIIDIQHSYSSSITVYVLRDNGELWGGGYNSDGQLGLGNTNNTYVNTCVKLRDDVKKVSHFAANVTVLTNDNKLLFAGTDARISSGSTVTKRSTWFDIGYRFSSVIPDFAEIKDFVSTENNMFVLTNSGNLYGVGLGRALGAGISSNAGNYTNTASLISSNVDTMQITLDGSTFQKKDGTIWGFGNNGYGSRFALDVSSPSSTSASAWILSPVQMFTTLNAGTAKGWYGGQNNNMLVSTDGSTTYGCGSPWYGTLGAGYNTDGAVGYLSTSSITTKTLPVPCAELIMGGTPNSMQRVYRGTDGFYYMIGYNPNGELGIGVTKGTGNDYAITEWTKNTVLPVPNDDVVGFSYGYFISYMYTKDSIYVCGNTNNYGIQVGVGAAVSTFTKIALPF